MGIKWESLPRRSIPGCFEKGSEPEAVRFRATLDPARRLASLVAPALTGPGPRKQLLRISHYLSRRFGTISLIQPRAGQAPRTAPTRAYEYAATRQSLSKRSRIVFVHIPLPR